MYLPKNKLEEILIKYHDKEWQWEYLSQNPNVSMDYICFNINIF